jgi:hypothetical protein
MTVEEANEQLASLAPAISKLACIPIEEVKTLGTEEITKAATAQNLIILPRTAVTETFDELYQHVSSFKYLTKADPELQHTEECINSQEDLDQLLLALQNAMFRVINFTQQCVPMLNCEVTYGRFDPNNPEA